MADRIFPNRFQEDALDSDLVFQGIDWDNFNERLAKAKEPKPMPKEVEKMLKEKGEASKPSKEDREDLSDVPPQLRDHVKKKQKSNDDDDDDDHEDHEDHEDEKSSKGPMKRKGPEKSEKVKKAFVFDHPSQLSAEAVEAAEAAGDDRLKNAILAARHDRRVRLASQIETRVAEQKDMAIRLAQRKAYREAIVQSVEESVVAPAPKQEPVFVKSSSMTSAMKSAFAQKALAEGFPVEYVQARLGENVVKVADNTSAIKNVMASELEINTKIAAASSMIKTATLSDADYSRLIDYWKNDLGYGDQEWIDALFTKKYDKKN